MVRSRVPVSSFESNLSLFLSIVLICCGVDDKEGEEGEGEEGEEGE